MVAKELNIGLIGCGFMGRAHSNAYRQIGQFFDLPLTPRLKTISGRDKPKVEKMAQRWGWENAVDDWRRMIDDPEIKVVDICSPNNTHHEIATAAAAAGEIILCEKSLAIRLAEAHDMLALRKLPASPQWFGSIYRRVPAIASAKQIIADGRLGRIFHYRATYLQDWTISPRVPVGGNATWRSEREVAGVGVSGDLITHNLDTAIWLNGPLASVCGMTEIFIRERA